MPPGAVLCLRCQKHARRSLTGDAPVLLIVLTDFGEVCRQQSGGLHRGGSACRDEAKLDGGPEFDNQSQKELLCQDNMFLIQILPDAFRTELQLNSAAKRGTALGNSEGSGRLMECSPLRSSVCVAS